MSLKYVRLFSVILRGKRSLLRLLANKDVSDAMPSYPSPTAVLPCSLEPAELRLPAKQVSVERLFSAMRLFLSDPRSQLKRDAVEAVLMLRTNMI